VCACVGVGVGVDVGVGVSAGVGIWRGCENVRFTRAHARARLEGS